MSARTAAAVEVPVRETLDLGPLADPTKAGVLVKKGELDRVFNQGCPDWCKAIGTHQRDVVKQISHDSVRVYAPLTQMRGYELRGKHYEASLALALRRFKGNTRTLIDIWHLYGDEDGDRVEERVGRFDLDAAKQVIDCLQVLIAAAEAES